MFLLSITGLRPQGRWRLVVLLVAVLALKGYGQDSHIQQIRIPMRVSAPSFGGLVMFKGEKTLTPANGVTVKLFTDANPQQEFQTTVNPDGSFAFDSVQATSGVLVVKFNDHESERWKVSITPHTRPLMLFLKKTN